MIPSRFNEKQLVNILSRGMRLLSLCAILAGPDNSLAVTTSVTLSEGTNLSESTPASGDPLVFDLAGRIWSISPGVKTAKALTDATEYAQRPVFSPDGTVIAYESTVQGFQQIVLMNADGTGAKQLTLGTSHQRSPASSPDVSRPAVASNRSGNYS